jgi:hypothetical protein
MAMTSFQSTNLAVAGGSCGLSMWDLVEEKRLCYNECPTPNARATAICQVKTNPTGIHPALFHHLFAATDGRRKRWFGFVRCDGDFRRLHSHLRRASRSGLIGS